MFEVNYKEKAFVAVVNTSVAYRGCVTYKQGINSSGEILLNVPTNSVLGAQACYPIDRITMRDDLGDTADAINKFAKGDRCIYYEGGVFTTDKFLFKSSVGGAVTPLSYSTTSASAGMYSTSMYTVGDQTVSFRSYLTVSTNASYYGYLTNVTFASSKPYASTAALRLNANFEALRILNCTPNAVLTYKVIPSRVGRGWVNATYN